MWLLSFILPILRLYLVGVKVLLYQLFNKSFTLPVLPTQNGRVAIVTGGARGMGYETARHLARLGMHVVIAGNSEEEGLQAVKKIHEEGSEGKVEFLFLHLCSLKSVRQFVHRFKARALPLHVLVNNAGVMLVPEGTTEEGFELHFGLNYLGHFLLTNLLLDKLKRSGRHDACSRVVTMSSATHYVGRLDMEDLQGRSCYSAHGAYSQSKLALVLFTYHLQEKITAGGFPVTSNAVDPGMVDTDLYNNLCIPVQAAKKPVAKMLFRDKNARPLSLSGHVGFDSLPHQLVNKSTCQGFCFNILCIGETGIGKSTLMVVLLDGTQATQEACNHDDSTQGDDEVGSRDGGEGW